MRANVKAQIQMCSVCIDASRFQAVVSERRQKVQYASRLLASISVDEDGFQKWKCDYISRICVIGVDATTVHFMCGDCIKADRSQMVQTEEELRQLLYQLFYVIFRDGNSQLYHEVLRMLQGYYPVTYQSLQWLWYERRRLHESA